MSRLTPLRPVAGAADAFERPILFQPDNDDSLASFSRGLAALNPALQKFTDVNFQANVYAARTAALEDMRQRQYKSMKDLQGAVDRGEISDAANPWKMVFLKQLTAREQVRGAFTTVQGEYENNPEIRREDNAGVVDGWASGRVRELIGDMDQWSAAAVADEIDRFRSEFSSRHIQRRSVDRQVETEAGFKRALSSDIEAFQDATDDGDEQAAAAALARINSAAGAAALVMRPDQVRELTVAAVADAAETFREPELLDSLLGKVEIGGLKVSDSMPAGTRERISRSVLEQQVRELQLGATRESLIADKQADTVLRQLLADPNADVDFSSLPADTQVKLKIAQRQMQERNKSDAVDTLVGDFVAGQDFSPTRFQKAALAMTAFGGEGLQGIAKMSQMMNIFQNGQRVEPDVDTLVQIHDTLLDVGLTSRQQMGALTELLIAGDIDKNTFEQYASRIRPQGPERDGENQILGAANQALGTELKAAMLTDARFLIPSMPLDGGATVVDSATGDELTHEAYLALQQAEVLLLSRYWQWADQNPAADIMARTTAIASIRSGIVQEITGLTTEQVQQELPRRRLKDDVTSDPVAHAGKALKWEENKLVYSFSDGSTEPVPEGFRLFKDARDFDTRRKQVLERLRLQEGTEEAMDLLASQVSIIGDSRLRFRLSRECVLLKYGADRGDEYDTQVEQSQFLIRQAERLLELRQRETSVYGFGNPITHGGIARPPVVPGFERSPVKLIRKRTVNLAELLQLQEQVAAQRKQFDEVLRGKLLDKQLQPNLNY